MKKRKLIAASLAVILAVALAAGGTLAYLNDTSVTATNEVDNNFNWVSLSESKGDPQTNEKDGNITNDAYEIIPGTSQEKDPTVNVSYSVDSYVYVAVEDTSGGLITWTPADGWTLLTGTDEYDADGNLTSAVYYRLVDGTESGADPQTTDDNVAYYKNSFSVLDGDSISYSSSITNADVVKEFDEDGDPTFLNNDIKLTFQAYIMQADISGNDGVNESALVCWNAMNAGSTAASVTAGNVEVETDGETGVTTTKEQVVVTSTDSAYSATVPAGVTIDTDTADIVTTTDAEGNKTTTTTLILVVEHVGDNYSTDSGQTVTTSAGQTATVYDISIIGVDNTNNTTVMEIAMDIGTGLYNVKVEHEGEDLTALEAQQSGTAYTDDQYYYDSTTGILYIYTDTFSEFAVYSMTSAYVTSNGQTGYDSLDAAITAGNVVVNEDTKVVYSKLNDAIKAASADETVTMLADMTENVTLSKSITLDLGGKTLTGTNTDTTSGTVTIGGNVTATITDGTITGTANGIWCNSTAMNLTLDGVTVSNNSNYGIYINSSSANTQTMTIKGNTTISGNNSGGIYGGSLMLTMDNGTISNNTGVGVEVASFTMNNGTISGNTGRSGAAVNGGTFVMNNGTISGNTVTMSGGAVYGSNVTINGGTITGTTGGSGIYMNGGTLTITGGTISNNSGRTYGGGVYCGNKCTFTMSGGTITGNSSTYQGTGIYFDSQNISATISGGSILNNNVVNSSGSVTSSNYGNIYALTTKPVISGGTFSFSVSSYLAEGCTQTTNSDGTYTVSASSAD